MGFTPL